MENIQALKVEKIIWPDDDFFGDDIWIISVDGTHFWIEEPQHPMWSQDSTFYSHKYNKAGLNYELGICLWNNQLVWMNGPYKAGTNDVKIFKRDGIRALLKRLKKKAIGDGGYCGHPKYMSTPISHDSRGVKIFKSCALKRHETFNGMIKVLHV